MTERLEKMLIFPYKCSLLYEVEKLATLEFSDICLPAVGGNASPVQVSASLISLPLLSNRIAMV